MIISQYVSKKLSTSLYEADIIKHSELDIYSYCFDYIIELMLNIIIFLGIGQFTHKFIISLIFLIVLIPMRSFGGGIHAPTPKICSLISFSLFFIVLYISNILSYMFTFEWCICFILAISIILILAPIDSPNKPMDNINRAKLKRYCIITCIAYVCLFLYFYIKHLQLYYGTTAICVIIVSLSILLGFIQNHIKTKNWISPYMCT